MSIQQEHLTRVSDRISASILVFWRKLGYGREFTMMELQTFVNERVKCSPDSPSRILRAMRLEGTVNYSVIDRAKSRYRILPSPGNQIPLF